ncbi:MAG: putative ABC transporter permease subunit [Thermodesulfobacteriota bacterium]
MRPILLFPLLRTTRNRFFPVGAFPAKGVGVALFGFALCLLLYLVSVRVVGYFYRQSDLGIILSLKIFQMGWIIMFAMLVFSSMVSAVSILFLSRDNEIVFAAPVSPEQLYFMRCYSIVTSTAWMMIIFSLPVFAAYGRVFAAGWGYQLLLVLCLLATALTAGLIGAGLTVLLVRFFPARQTKDIVFYLSLCFGLFLYIMFRMLKPEQLVNPDRYGDFIEYLSAVSQPAGPYVPAAWAANLLSLYLVDREIDWLLLALLLLGPPSLFFVGEWLMARFFFTAFSKSQESFGGYRSFAGRSGYRRGAMRWIFRKETKVFLRDSAEWSQLFMIAALLVVYLYSFKALPLERSPLQTEYITNLISFLNVGMAGFMVTSLAARFVFPAIGAETGAFWLIAAAPMTVNRFLFCKFLFYVAPFTAFGLFLVIASDSLLAIEGPMWWFSVTAILVICWTVVGLAVGFGALHADFKAENRAAAQGGLGAMLFLFCAMSFVFAVVAGGAYPIYYLTRSWIRDGVLGSGPLLLLALWLVIAVAVGGGLVLVFWRRGCRRLSP